MKRFALSLAALMLIHGTGPAAPVHGTGPRIEVLFVLDTTGSMGGLIDGAKQKIWSIANQMLQANPTPSLRVGLIGYRDRGDEYITRFTDLTEDLDSVSAQLRQFQANGGNDTPESVNQALREAVDRPTWSSDPKVLKLIFLVGDAPPHMDYPNDIPYQVSLRKAVARDLIVNTVQCGQAQDTTTYWKDIATLGRGAYMPTGQTGHMHVISTPMDAELARLNTEVGTTIVPYGEERQREMVAQKQKASEAVAACAPSVAADRLEYNRKSNKVVQGGGDLLDAVASGSVSVEKLDTAQLPPPMKGLSPAARKAFIAGKQEQRRKIQARIDDLTRQRQAYLAKAAAKEGKGDAFDVQVAQVVKAQAKPKGILF